MCTEQSLLQPCTLLGVMDPRMAAQFIVVNNTDFHSASLPKIYLALALALKQLWQGRGLLLGEHYPKSASEFKVISDHSFGPLTLMLTLILDLEVLEYFSINISTIFIEKLTSTARKYSAKHL